MNNPKFWFALYMANARVIRWVHAVESWLGRRYWKAHARWLQQHPEYQVDDYDQESA